MLPTTTRTVMIGQDGKYTLKNTIVEVLAVYFTTNKIRIRYRSEYSHGDHDEHAVVTDVDAPEYIKSLMEMLNEN